jgi:hypothetical protein
VEVSHKHLYYTDTPTFEQINDFLTQVGFVTKLRKMHGHNGLKELFVCKSIYPHAG